MRRLAPSVRSETQASRKTRSRRWIDGISSRCRQFPLLTTAVVIYGILTAGEITHNFVIAQPLDRDDAGFSRWQAVPAPDGSNATLLFRWSEPVSTIRRPVEAPVLGLMVYRPEDAEGQVDVAFSLDGEPLDAYTVGQGAYWFRFYLPSILAPDKWTDARVRLDERVRAEAEQAVVGWFANWQELKPWSRPPAPPSIEIDTRLATVAPGSESPDAPIAGIATVEWLDELPTDGAGFHGEIGEADGFAFRWTRRWASLPLRVAGSEAVLRIRAIHPDIDREPVTVSVFWNERPVESVPLSNTDWTEVAVALGAEVGATGVLSIHVDRTWSPARAGVSEDRREFGVAFGDVAWR